MNYNTSVVALDIGTAKTCAVSAGHTKNGWQILGIGVSGTEGIKKGKLVQPALTVNSIKLALERAQMAAKLSPKKAVIALPMSVCGSFWNQCSIDFYAPRKVQQEDIDRLKKKLADIDLNKKVHILRSFVQTFTLDNKKELISSPLGLTAQKLSASGPAFYLDEIDLIHWQQLLKGFSFERIYFSVGLEALAKAVIPASQRQTGTLLLDIGGGLTQIGLVQNDRLQQGTYITVAGNHVLTDIMYGLNVPAGEARRLLFEHGQAQGQSEDDSMLTVLGAAGEERTQASRGYFYKIIQARIEEIFKLVQDKLVQWEREGIALPQTVFLAGGLSLLPGIAAAAEKALKRQALLGEKKKTIVYQTAEGSLSSAEEQIAPRLSLLKMSAKATAAWFKEFA